MRPYKRDDGLHDRDKEREDEGEMTEFCNHVVEYRRSERRDQCVSSVWTVHIVAGFQLTRPQVLAALSQPFLKCCIAVRLWFFYLNDGF